LLETREHAMSYPKGDFAAALCDHCGFIANVDFDPALNAYAEKYESTQSFSPTFNAFAHGLATTLIERYDLHGKDIIEIGCGQGEFLTLLCELGGNRGVGFDPAYRNEPLASEARDRLRFVADFYSERYTDYHADFVCCKMTLEHIPDTLRFMQTVRRSIGRRRDTVVFFQIPNGLYVLGDIAFWDMYYEHCSYFSPASLKALFRASGFEVLATWTGYDDQYLMIEARPADETPQESPTIDADDLAVVRRSVQHFKDGIGARLDYWRALFADIRAAGQRAVIWGGGSKGVSFLTTLGAHDAIAYAVDINPRKTGTFMAGAGQEIVHPDFLRDYRPDLVIVMNPIYMDEIRAVFEGMGQHPRLASISGEASA
ncbi:MAG: methyltransferase domain-containing protein, partial [Anaerolineae bacterium]|nr:methyltransferase domain-containing protein [Anaerolineae bacterium]